MLCGGFLQSTIINILERGRERGRNRGRFSDLRQVSVINQISKQPSRFSVNHHFHVLHTWYTNLLNEQTYFTNTLIWKLTGNSGYVRSLVVFSTRGRIINTERHLLYGRKHVAHSAPFLARLSAVLTMIQQFVVV